MEFLSSSTFWLCFFACEISFLLGVMYGMNQGMKVVTKAAEKGINEAFEVWEKKIKREK